MMTDEAAASLARKMVAAIVEANETGKQRYSPTWIDDDARMDEVVIDGKVDMIELARLALDMKKIGQCRDCRHWSQEDPSWGNLLLPDHVQEWDDDDCRSTPEIARDTGWGNCRLFGCDGTSLTSPEVRAGALDDWRGCFACRHDFGCVEFAEKEVRR